MTFIDRFFNHIVGEVDCTKGVVISIYFEQFANSIGVNSSDNTPWREGHA